MTEIYPNIGPQAADYIRTHGWVQRTMQDGSGRVCLHGAIKSCMPKLGDSEIVRSVARMKGMSESWNDAALRDVSEIFGKLDSFVVTDDDLQELYGEQWEAVVQLIRNLSSITPRKVKALVRANKRTMKKLKKEGRSDEMTDAQVRAAAYWVPVKNPAVASVSSSLPARQFSEAGFIAQLARQTVEALTTQKFIRENVFSATALTQEDFDLLTKDWYTVFPKKEKK